jgi:hypothetical protein
MPYYYKFELEYSDCGDDWYEGEQKWTHDEFTKRLIDAFPRVIEKKALHEKAKWCECESTFGIRKWPYCGGMISTKGTIEDFYAWRDKYKFDFMDEWLALIGLTPLKPTLETDTGRGIDNVEGAALFIEQLLTK